jgi:hypothetical protein
MRKVRGSCPTLYPEVVISASARPAVRSALKTAVIFAAFAEAAAAADAARVSTLRRTAARSGVIAASPRPAAVISGIRGGFGIA